MNKGRLIVFAAPAGGGKTTIIKEIRRLHPEWGFSVSATTRPMRQGERDGEDYYFLSKEEFERRVTQGLFLEHEEVHGNLYGTLRDVTANRITNGETLILDLDVKGAASIKRIFPDALTIFIRPPSLEILEQRLRARGSETEETLRKRLSRAQMEMSRAPDFDCVVVNDEIPRAVAEVESHISK